MRRKIRIVGRIISGFRSPELKSDQVNSSSHVIFKVCWVGSGDVFTGGVGISSAYAVSNAQKLFHFPFLHGN